MSKRIGFQSQITEGVQKPYPSPPTQTHTGLYFQTKCVQFRQEILPVKNSGSNITEGIIQKIPFLS